MRRFGNFAYAATAFIVLAACVTLITSRTAVGTTGVSWVRVTNVPTDSVNVRDVDTPGRQAVQFTLSPSSGVSSFSQDQFTVPAGKRLVIEYYSAQLTQYPSSGYAYMYMTTSVGGNTNYYKVIPPSSTTAPFNQLTRIYADPGTQVTAQVTQSSGTSSGGNLIVSGYYINVP